MRGRRQAHCLLRAAGFRVDALCLRREGERVRVGKQCCRDRFRAAGWTLVFNIGNRPTDFVGGGYERAWKLPGYGLRLA